MAHWLRKAYWNVFTVWQARNEAQFPYLPLEAILAAQNRRVRAIVAHAYATVPYYREVMDHAGLRPEDFHTADDLARLPILTGEQVAHAPERFRSRAYADGDIIQLQSTGTSGRAKRVYYDTSALFLAFAHGHRQRTALAHYVGRTLGYREMVVTRSVGVNNQLRSFYEAYSWTPKGLDLTRDTVLPKGSLTEDIAQINAFRPDVIRGYGSYIGAIFRWAREHKIPVSRPKAIVYGAEAMPETDRLLIETEFGVPVLSTYQATEALRIAFQCEQREGFHLSLDDVAVRVVDDNGHPLAPGDTGAIVLSNLTNRAMVLLNYKLGDVVTLGKSSCPCGRALPTIERIRGRSDDLIALPGERVIHSLVVITPLQAVAGVVHVQVVQEDLRRFRLRVVCASAVDWQQTRRQLDAALRVTLGNDLSLTIERVAAIPSEPGGKVRAVISYYRRDVNSQKVIASEE